MHQIYNYDIYIFDCDGVILDSNSLKIQAMEDSLNLLSFTPEQVSRCVDYFAKNFGKSRFHHVAYFLENFISIKGDDHTKVEREILDNYSKKCRNLYMQAELTPGFLDFVASLDGCKYIASGSEENELKEVFNKRGLDKLFNGIYGSPLRKDELILNILSKAGTTNAIMFGDAISDLNAATNNHIDFIGYLPYSNVRNEMQSYCISNGFKFIYSWLDLK